MLRRDVRKKNRNKEYKLTRISTTIEILMNKAHTQCIIVS